MTASRRQVPGAAIRRLPLLAPLAVLAAVLAGCAANAPAPAVLTVETVTLRMASGVNDDWPVPVELVRVADPAALDQLLAMNAADWFGDAGEAFRVANTDALYDAWEIVPGTTAGPFDIRVPGRFNGVLFCDVRGEDPQLAAPFERDGDVLVSIKDTGCALAGGCASRRPGLLSVAWGGRTCTGRALPRPEYPTRIREISFEVAEGSNGNWPVSVELVRTADGSLIEQLMDIDTAAWFDELAEEFRNANPTVRYDSWEVVPGTVAGPYAIRLDGLAAGVLFCRASGSFGPIPVGPAASAVVVIDAGGCELQSRARPRSW